LRSVSDRGSQLLTRKMNSTQTALEHTEIPNEADWALGDNPNNINATGFLAEDLEEYGGMCYNIKSDYNIVFSIRVASAYVTSDHYRIDIFI